MFNPFSAFAELLGAETDDSNRAEQARGLYVKGVTVDGQGRLVKRSDPFAVAGRLVDKITGAEVIK